MTSYVQVKAVVAALLRVNKIANATHNIMAYRIHVPDKQAFLQVWGRRRERAGAAAGCRVRGKPGVTAGMWEPGEGRSLNSGSCSCEVMIPPCRICIMLNQRTQLVWRQLAVWRGVMAPLCLLLFRSDTLELAL